ncbi:DUF4333 domain-containing protein [Nocardia takedensis]|uniref:DUF4333 domain-containing protein n=1 Tax=Nocardia takedensis TaxID=259390 RepID=UPI000A0108C1|nr:DUF4333 domain-containing protein [Nocardia takedensis]
MTVPTRQPNTSRPYPIAEPPREPESGYDANGWVPVIIAGVAAAFAIAIVGVIAALVVVNIRESAPRAPKPAVASQTTAAPTTPVLAVPPVEVLDRAAVQRGVASVLGESYGFDDVRTVNCPAEQPVAIGTVFDCAVRVDGAARTVTVTVTDEIGTYEVSRPF